jgi:S-DNA-T family DNA segregation ATPase FtsK/SpoIIIE
MPLEEMPHLLIAGSTGSGKSVLLHAIITALIKQMPAERMGLVLIDPKRVELSAFKTAKQLLGKKIIYEYDEALLILKGLTDEMEHRYKRLEATECRDIVQYNMISGGATGKMPYIVTIIDEFADLIMQGKSIERRKKNSSSLKNIAKRAEVEQMARKMAKMGIAYTPKIEATDEQQPADELIARLAQMARAVGIHLIIATQRPSVDVITGLIKANFPTRIAMTTASATDSKVILGEEGAEKLSGKGDLLLMSPGQPKIRLQGFLTK